MRTLIAMSIALATSAGASAQTLPHPDCATLPNGGALEISVPGAWGPPVCQTCSGFGIPANPVFGFTDQWRGTCEIKRPDGSNSGLCKKETTCPPGTTKTSRSGVWGCEGPAVESIIQCPAPPRAPSTTPGATPGTPRQPPACIQQMQQWESQLKAKEQALRAALADDANLKGSAAAMATLKGAEAVVLLGAGIGHVWVQAGPLMIRMDVKCGDAAELNPTLMAECNKARADYKAAEQTNDGLWASYVRAQEESKRNLDLLSTGDTKENGKRAAADLRRGLDDAKRQMEACIAEIKRGGTLPRPF